MNRAVLFYPEKRGHGQGRKGAVLVKMGGWPYVVLIAPNEAVLHQETERDIRNARDFVDKYSDIIEKGLSE